MVRISCTEVDVVIGISRENKRWSSYHLGLPRIGSWSANKSMHYSRKQPSMTNPHLEFLILSLVASTGFEYWVQCWLLAFHFSNYFVLLLEAAEEVVPSPTYVPTHHLSLKKLAIIHELKKLCLSVVI